MTTLSSLLTPQDGGFLPSLDWDERLKYTNSALQSFLHPDKKQRLNQSYTTYIKTLFQEHFHIDNRKDFNNIWRAIGANKIWNSSLPMTMERLQELTHLFQTTIVYHGSGMACPAYNIQNDHDGKLKTVQMLADALLHCGVITNDVFQRYVLEGGLRKLDPEMMVHFRNILQHKLNHLTQNPPSINTPQELLWRTFLGNILVIFPFTYPSNNDTITIPILDKVVCRSVEYEVQVIKLPLTDLATPMHALGLTPKNDLLAPPILNLMGTTFPAADGHIESILADFTPGCTIGESLVNVNHLTLDRWMHDKTGVWILGTSLGGGTALNLYRRYALGEDTPEGSLTLPLLRQDPNKVTRIEAFNSPGLLSRSWETTNQTNCKVNIFTQKGDVVSKLGQWPKGDNVSLYHIISHHEGILKNVFGNHARAFTGGDRVTILKLEPEVINQVKSRRFLTFLHKYASWTIYIPVICALYFKKMIHTISESIKSCVHDLKKHKWTNLKY